MIAADTLHDRLLDQATADAAPADRAVLVDDGKAITLTAYAGADRLAVVEVSPLRARRLGSRADRGRAVEARAMTLRRLAPGAGTRRISREPSCPHGGEPARAGGWIKAPNLPSQ